MLNIETSALIVIDIQEKLVNAANNGEKAAENVAKIVKAANLLNIPTIITEQYPKGLGNTIQAIREAKGENSTTIEKTAFSALLEPEFAEEIQPINRKQIVIGGIETHICVLQTAIDFISEGYKVYIIKDACASRNTEEYETGLELLKQHGAKIICTEIVLFEWLKTSKHPKFKEIQALIK